MIPNLRKRFTAYVVFSGSENRRFWRIFLRRGWRHVQVIIPAKPPGSTLWDPGVSQVINFWTDHVRSDVVWMGAEELARLELKQGATCVIRLPVDQKFSGRYLPRGLFTCVSLVKALVSVNAWWIWTPEQLARYLLRNGGTLVEKQHVEPLQQRSQGGQKGAGSAAESAAPAGSGVEPADGR